MGQNSRSRGKEITRKKVDTAWQREDAGVMVKHVLIEY